MILRLLTARVPGINIGTFNDLLRAQVTELKTQPGLLYVKLARRLEDDGSEEVVLIEEWRTSADLFEWTRGRLAQPRLLPGTEELIDRLVITHYEALDVTPDDLSRRLLGGPPTDHGESRPTNLRDPVTSETAERPAADARDPAPQARSA